MARSAGLAPQQLRALARLKSVKGIDRFYLARGTALAFHLHHRRSEDLDLFGPSNAAFSHFQALARAHGRSAQVITIGEVTLHMEVNGVPLDVVRYPYPPLQRPTVGPEGI